MKKHFFLLLTAVGFLSARSIAQDIIPCKTSEMLQKAKERSTLVEAFEKTLDAQTKAYVSRGYINKFARTTSVDQHHDTDYYDIPLVVHVVENYGRENFYTSDNKIYELIKEMNRFYDNQTSFSTVVSEFRPYIGHPKFRFYLASKDPNGNPTNGITRRRTYLTYGYDEQAKVDQWPPTSYVNIWFESNIGGQPDPTQIVVAYATPPASGASFPPSDGIISNYSFINDAATDQPERTGGSIDHEMGHIFNLIHTFGGAGGPHTNTSGNCGSDDDVDDTPPCEGNLGGCNLTDTVCSRNYFKTYPSADGGDSLVNYPDTANEQNIMNYADCKVMFTKGQVARMRAALNSDVAGRNNLWDSLNLVSTGVGTIDYATGNVTPFTRVDLKPNPEFAAFVGTLGDPSGVNTVTAFNYGNVMSYFTFPGKDVKFVNETWNDTVTSTTWTFSNSALQPTVTQTNPTMGQTAFLNHFGDAGWVTLSMKATGNGTSGDTTATWPRAVFVADATGTSGSGYNQDFNGADTAKWPTFNYFNNNLHWQMSSVGRYDHSSMEYVGYDDRLNPLLGLYPSTSTPKGDFDDLFTVPFDLTSFSGGHCTMNFRYASASRSPISLNLTDTLEIDYSVNMSNTWTKMVALTKGTLVNNGAVFYPYTPVSPNEWSLFSMDVPSAARQNYVVFRFRYKPNVGIGHDATGAKVDAYSSGNNFYMDDFNFSPWAAGVEDVKLGTIDMAVVPNPTSGNAYVVVKDVNNATADVTVTDITGKVVYTTSQQMSGSQTQIEIPRAVISVGGMYLVRVATGSQARTEKLVVE